MIRPNSLAYRVKMRRLDWELPIDLAPPRPLGHRHVPVVASIMEFKSPPTAPYGSPPVHALDWLLDCSHSDRRGLRLATSRNPTMTKTEHYCDRCSRLIDRRTLLRVEAGAIRAHHESLEFCGACSDAFMTFLGPAVTEQGAPSRSGATAGA